MNNRRLGLGLRLLNPSAFFFSTGRVLFLERAPEIAFPNRAISHDGLPGSPGRLQAFSSPKNRPPGITGAQVTSPGHRDIATPGP